MAEKEIKYWRVGTDDGYLVIQARVYRITDRGDLNFFGEPKDKFQGIVTINKHTWDSVVQCDENGDPLWSKKYKFYNVEWVNEQDT